MNISDCWAYSKVKATARLCDHVIFLQLDNESKSVNLTFNPMQVKALGEFLEGAADLVKPADTYYRADFETCLIDEQEGEDKKVIIDKPVLKVKVNSSSASDEDDKLPDVA